jgi:hypothetical protein
MKTVDAPLPSSTIVLRLLIVTSLQILAISAGLIAIAEKGM